MLHITSIKPLFTSILTTGDVFEEDMYDGAVLVANKGDLKLWQKVVAIGSAVRDINVGDMVMIIPEHFAVKKYNKNSVQNDLDNNPVLTYHFPFETIEDSEGTPHEYLYLESRDIRYVFEGKEKEDSSFTGGHKIILPKTNLIVN